MIKGKKTTAPPLVFNSISELHGTLGLPQPVHPVVSLVDYSTIKASPEVLSASMILHFYKVSYKKNLNDKIKYGQHHYDFTERGMSFALTNQLISGTKSDKDYAGYTSLFHPDFIHKYSLAKNIKQYGFFPYSANKTLHLSEKEKKLILSVFENIAQELNTAIDKFNQELILSYISVLLNYSNRFDRRQFITRKTANHNLPEQLELLLDAYFNEETALIKGLPSVKHISAKLHISPRYLSNLLRTFTGQNTQQHLHHKLIEKAKELLSGDRLSVAEVAYQLGLGHPQSFNKIFKRKTELTPIAFTQTLN